MTPPCPRCGESPCVKCVKEIFLGVLACKVEPLTPEQWLRAAEWAGRIPVQRANRDELADSDGTSRDDGEAR